MTMPATTKIRNISIVAASGYGGILAQPGFHCRAEMLLPTQISNGSMGRKSSFGRISTEVTRCCTMRPGVDSGSATDRNPPVELDSCSTPDQLVATPPNQPHSSSYTKGLVFDKGPAGSWDSAATGSPVVKRYIGDDEERWYMWYHGRSDGSQASDSVGLALSKNGIHWAWGGGAVRSCGDTGLVLNSQDNWWAFDTKSIRPSELVIMSSPMYSSVYWLYYTGCSSDEVRIPEDVKILFQAGSGVNKIYKSLPGLACSQDGRHWGRIEGDHHSGALLDAGSADEWDSLFIAAPSVVLHGADDLRMYYHSFDARSNHFCIGMARSRDGIRWVKLGRIMGGGATGSFDELGSMSPNVVRNPREGNYLMAYEGLSATGARSIGLAESPDGLTNWARVGKDPFPVLEPSGEDGWDSRSVGSPCLVQMDGSSAGWRLYYEGMGRDGRTGIGMATCKGKEPTSFRRWEGFHC
uniref:Glycosyl hydrolase family 32 N-terminal domain-containing protein n=1 Tax=Kalanchoe fedtschenkoi TaxID=63787 RepID=A0A7N0V6D3_KALFE